jgi:glycosyltransferase involved in cell wall biosynthesis
MARDEVYVPIAPSTWMARQAMKTRAFAKPPRIIPYGVETETFHPRPRSEVRQLLGLPQDVFTVLITAHTLGAPRKGTELVVQSLRALNRDICLVAIGHADEKTVRLLKSVKAYTPGFVNDIKLLSLYYAAADVFCCPSSVDNLPMVVLETMASGTPTVGFGSGGIPDMVKHEINGWLAKPGNCAELLQGLRIAQEQPEIRLKWGEESRAMAVDLFSNKRFLEAHISLYQEILSDGQNFRRSPGLK